MPTEAAAMAAVLFVVLPVHTESVATITGRSDLLCLFFLLLAWLDLDSAGHLTAKNTTLFFLALFTKEQAAIFPLVWMLGDWTFHSQDRSASSRVKTFGGLSASVFLYLIIRGMILGYHFNGGIDYFSGKTYLVRLLTMARFTVEYSLVSLVTGCRSYVDYSRPLVPYATMHDPLAWVYLAIILGSVAASTWMTQRKSRSAFWFLLGFLFLLPTSNLLFPLDSLGAPRFLYMSSLGFCVLLSQSLLHITSSVWRKTLILLLTISYACMATAQIPVWTNIGTMIQSMIRDNPLSDRGWMSLAVEQLRKGDKEACRKTLDKVGMLNPKNPDLYYNLGCLHYQKEEWNAAQNAFEKTVSLNPGESDAWLHLGLLAEHKKNTERALTCYRNALLIRVSDSVAHYNTARLLLAGGHIKEAVWHYQYFLKVTPQADEAPIARKVLALIYKDYPQLEKS
jgi:hypothetical protein